MPNILLVLVQGIMRWVIKYFHGRRRYRESQRSAGPHGDWTCCFYRHGGSPRGLPRHSSCTQPGQVLRHIRIRDDRRDEAAGHHPVHAPRGCGLERPGIEVSGSWDDARARQDARDYREDHVQRTCPPRYSAAAAGTRQGTEEVRGVARSLTQALGRPSVARGAAQEMAGTPTGDASTPARRITS